MGYLGFSYPACGEDGSQNGTMLRGLRGWKVIPVVTVGEQLPSRDLNAMGGRYQPPGSMDGLGAFALDVQTVRVLINHELSRDAGYPYRLRNETRLAGARVSFIDLDQKTRRVVNSGVAFDTVYDRHGWVVTSVGQTNETRAGWFGLSRLCSAQFVKARRYGFVDNIFFTHEEISDPFDHPHGGSLWALDVDSKSLQAVPGAGRMSWENSTPLEISGDRIAFLIGDDSKPQSQEAGTFGALATVHTLRKNIVGAPLWLFIGKKNAFPFEIHNTLPGYELLGPNNFLNRNGLLVGDLYYFVAKNGLTTVDEFRGSGSVLSGKWVKIKTSDSAKAGRPGYDEWGYKDGFTLRREAKAGGAFQFSRPEDVSTHPTVGTRAVFSSTGIDVIFPEDAWGTIYQVDLNFDSMSAALTILYDADERKAPGPDFGIRNPDNLDWADDGFIYVQEDPAKKVMPWFGSQSKQEASIWKFHPDKGTIQRIAQINRSVSLIGHATDSSPAVMGAWESSGILDVTQLFDALPGERLLLATVQAGTVYDGLIKEANLVEGGQLVFLSRQGE